MNAPNRNLPAGRRWATLLLSLGLLVLLGAVSSLQLWRLHLAERDVSVSHDILTSVRRLLTHLTEAESSQRGYLLTGDELYLEPYQKAVQRIPRLLDELDAQGHVSQVTREEFQRISVGTKSKLEELDRSISLERAGDHAGALALINTHTGRSYMAELRRLLDEMLAEEERRLTVRRRFGSESYDLGILAIVITSLSSAALVGVLFGIVRRAERLRLEEQRAHEEQKELLRTTLMSLTDAVLITDPSGRITFFNDAAEQLLETTSAEVADLPIEEVVVLRDESRANDRLFPARVALEEGETTREVRLDLDTPSGLHVLVSAFATPIVDPSGTLVGAVLILSDVTENQRAERARRRRFQLQRTEAELGVTMTSQSAIEPMLKRAAQAMAETLELPLVHIWMTSEDKKSLTLGACSAAVEFAPRTIPFDPRTVEKITSEREFSIDDPNVSDFRPEDDFATSARYFAGYPLLLGDELLGLLIFFSAEAFDDTLLAGGTNLARQIAIGLDRRVQELKILEMAERKDEFLATLSHELRGPLAPIVSSTALLRRVGPDPRSFERLFSVIERQTAQIVRLVDDLLDVNRISLGKVSLRPSPLILQDVIRQAVETLGATLEERSQHLEVQMPDEPVRLSGDAARLVQVIYNLLSNASRYTDPEGKITLTLRSDGSAAQVRISDDGIGIAPEKLGSVFELFEQIEPNGGRGTKGLGIGLTLAKRLVDLHGGVIEAESPGLGLGTTFVVTLPLVDAMARAPLGSFTSTTSPPPPEPRPASDGPRRVLVVDDSVDGAETLGLLLESSGAEVRLAHDGLEALEVAREFLPEIVFLDIGLPKLSGHEVASRLRAESWGKSMRLVALTGWGQEADRELSRRAGCDQHLVKPIDVESVRSILAS